MADKDDISLDIQSLIEDGKNKQTIYCIQCPSKILCSGVGLYKEIDYPLPNVTAKKARTEEDKDEEELKDYWQVDNMYHFENIGFSNTVDGKKYLICSDCEIGPIGWQNLETKASYLAVKRVKYCDK